METDALNGKRVMIVEDDPLLHTLLADKLAQLREKGVAVIAVMNAEEGLAQAQAQHPDLVMLDLALPDMNGFEFLEHIRAIPALAPTPVVILSNLSGDQDKARAKQLGVIAYLVKADSSLTDISGAIEALLRGEAMPRVDAATPQVEKTTWGYMMHL